MQTFPALIPHTTAPGDLADNTTGLYVPRRCQSAKQAVSLCPLKHAWHCRSPHTPPGQSQVVDAVSKYAIGHVSTTLGVPNVLSDNTTGIPAAVAMAAAADNVVLAVGTDLSWAREGHDAENISFTDAQLQLISQCASVAKKPIVVVILTATPLDISALLSNPKVGAILHTGQPSVTVLGIAELLFGKVSPAGRTIQTIYPASYQDQISIFDFNMRPGPSAFVRPDCQVKCPNFHPGPWNPMMHGGPCGDCEMGTNPGRTHRFYTGKAVVPFGFGLSYTTWAYEALTLEHPGGMLPLQAGPPGGDVFMPAATAVVTLRNSGQVAGQEVVQVYVVDPAGLPFVPFWRRVVGFAKVHLAPGERAAVRVPLLWADLAQYDTGMELQLFPGVYNVSAGGASNSRPVSATLTVAGM